ncbi:MULTISPECIES: ABC transporter ATP-binding protein [Chitinophaga]|uniref:ABC transporter ATP-binding protein n=1 Tax=Chitinophaga TaxID=79328 RepID=UPI000DBF8A25|nr:ABC transporter ATP-binding protein [Chitinophaga ginsengisegetis]MDR6566017.1 ATP-binding cassette subfamily B protein [Chitinophaga ginsengisegetis]MDR6645746.1 ATP-binding cassette subfamily B protein [Chitinophaga ginsengisegetis]MDR6651662.1 ATP-binding cassette subfamily B protein [Chitinophaga ginsengisegetis]
MSAMATPRKKRPGKDEKLTFKERLAALRNLPAFFRMVWQTSPGLAIGNTVLRVAQSAMPLSLLYVGKLIIDQVVHLTKDPGHSTTWLWQLVALEFGLAILSDALSRAISLLDGLLGDLFANHTSVKIMEHAAKLDLDQFEDAEFYDKLERARQQTSGRTVLLAQVLSQVQDIITIVFLAAGLVFFNPWLILLLLLAVIPAFLNESHFNDLYYKLAWGQTSDRRELDYIRYLGASDETAKEVKVFDLSNFLINRFKFISNKFYTDKKVLQIRDSIWGTIFAIVGAAGYYAAYVIIILQTIRGHLSIGDLAFLAGSFRQLRTTFQGILIRFSSVTQGALYLRDLFEYFEIQPKMVPVLHPRAFPRPIQQGFTFEDVGFKYINSDKWAIRHLNFTLHPGEKLALVGENGAGKTTLVKLLSRLYDPVEGRILLDGIDLREYDLKELRTQVGVIFQDYQRYQMTVSQNIAVGNIAQSNNLPMIEDAARQSLASPLIEKMPLGYEQMLGRRFNQGIELSGGEWQKIALARAYMKDAQLLILDEPTSALDARAEYNVFLRFADLTRDKTAVLISHRFSTVRMANRILVLERGTLVEIGSHEELLARKGRYAELFELQAAGYK